MVCGTIAVGGIAVGINMSRYTSNQPRAAIDHDRYVMDSIAIVDILDATPRYNPYVERYDSMPPGGVRLNVDRSIRYGRVFNDSNYRHLASARVLGFNPIDTEADAWSASRPVVKVESNKNFYVDQLTHSLPYLVPEAYTLLDEIGQSFSDSLNARGGGAYRIKVTSLLRTNSSVRRLRRRNRNAVGGSAHLYGTTFDISYSNFVCDSVTVPRTVDDMKYLLAEILRDYRDHGRCYVKHERKQSCFHITVRQPMSDSEGDTL